ncbi:transient receptor potential cation channel protein painless-like [Zophobas morio]|uniref:transient receptor potential cation channel protein painless-like n=1 Tax=Zophobas morio TaxID=2755281 RepID=UPI0030832595
MSEETIVLMEREESPQPKGKYDRMLFFNLFRKIMSICGQKHIDRKKIETLQKSNDVLESIETLNLLIKEEATLTKMQLKNTIRAELLQVMFKKCEQNGGDAIDLCFFASAICNKDVVKENISKCTSELLNTPIFFNTILTFTLKHAKISEPNFFECVELLLEAGVDINKPDFCGKTAVEHVAFLYKRNSQEEIKIKLEQLIVKLKEKGVLWEILDEETKNIIKMPTKSEEKHIDDDTINQLFCWIGKENIKEFVKFRNIRNFANCSNGEYTLLQFACKRSEKMHVVVKFLLDHNADPNKVTELYPFKPAEIAARKKHEQSFQEILKNKNLEITQEMFNHFVQWRTVGVKRKLFEMFLESNNLEPSLTCKFSGNTPLHYAVRFSHRKAIQKILKHPKNMLDVTNDAGKVVLDVMRVDDLKAHFDACLVLDTYNDFGSDDYKMHLRFKSLVSDSSGQIDEMKIISKIAKNRNLCELLSHPLVNTFLELKWSKVAFYYWLVLVLQFFLFTALSSCFYLLCEVPSTNFWLCVFFILLNSVTKIPFITAPYFCGKRQPPTLYETLEILVALTLFGAFFSVECRAFAFVEMSVLCLLTVGYHPRIAKWSAMMKKVFKSFTYLMVFFSLILLAFAVAFQLLFKDEGFFKNIWKSLFVTYVMTTGEFNMNENFAFSTTGHYVVFFVFAIFVALVMVNFWTGVAVTDVSSIEKNAEINAFKNVISFMGFVEKRLWGREFLRISRLPNPLLFFDTKKKYDVGFYINREKQFESGEGFPDNVGSKCLEKIREFCSKQMDSSNDTQVMSRLEGLEKMLLDIKNSINSHKGDVFQKENKKNQKDN